MVGLLASSDAGCGFDPWSDQPPPIKRLIISVLFDKTSSYNHILNLVVFF
jgi:hypothetical protein